MYLYLIKHSKYFFVEKKYNKYTEKNLNSQYV